MYTFRAGFCNGAESERTVLKSINRSKKLQPFLNQYAVREEEKKSVTDEHLNGRTKRDKEEPFSSEYPLLSRKKNFFVYIMNIVKCSFIISIMKKNLYICPIIPAPTEMALP